MIVQCPYPCWAFYDTDDYSECPICWIERNLEEKMDKDKRDEIAKAIGQIQDERHDKLRKEARKSRRKRIKVLANGVMIDLITNLNLDIPSLKEGQVLTMPSIKNSDSIALAALLRMNRRLKVMMLLAQRALDQRYQNEDKRRRRELKKAYRAKIVAERNQQK